ncbi:MAG: hypothetical protein GY835_04245 [bacterium]|nr:hypothetical protein [bacterium]
MAIDGNLRSRAGKSFAILKIALSVMKLGLGEADRETDVKPADSTWGFTRISM